MKHPPSNSRPRIGYLLRMYPRFSQTFLVNEMLELERQGLSLRIASLRKPTDGVFHESIARLGAKADYFPEAILSEFSRLWPAQWSRLRRNPADYLRGVGAMFRHSGAALIDLLQAAHLLRWVKKNEVDHVHVHFGTNEATVAYLAHLLGGLSYSLTLHAFDIFRDNVDRSLLSRKINASRFTVTVSEFNRRYIQDAFPGVRMEKVRVNYNGIDLARFDAASADRDPRLVFSVGRLIEKKGFIHLIRAVRILTDAGLLVDCHIAGEGPEANGLQSEINRSGLHDRITLLGNVEQAEVSRWMKRAACFALPCVQAKDGNMDALPTVLLESLASGCPSISTRVSGVPEIIEDGVSGLLVGSGDEAALAQAIRRVIDDTALARSLGEAGRRRAVELFDVRRNVRHMHEWLMEAVSSKQPCPALACILGSRETPGALGLQPASALATRATPC